MVKVTVYIEGGENFPGDTSDTLSADSSLIYRESFSRLLSQELPDQEFDLVIQPIGSVNRAKKYLEKISNEEGDAVLLIDLDGPESLREDRLKFYEPYKTTPVYFMVQEMEAWLLSQPQKIEEYAKIATWTRKREDEDIAADVLIRNIHPADIASPSVKLDTILRKYYLIEKVRKGKTKSKPKSYTKSKDGPGLVSLLNLSSLKETFTDVASLVEYIRSKNVL